MQSSNKKNVKKSNAKQDFVISFKTSEYESSTEFKERYDIIDDIGRGGQAFVKKAIDRQSDEMVALKIF